MGFLKLFLKLLFPKSITMMIQTLHGYLNQPYTVSKTTRAL